MCLPSNRLSDVGRASFKGLVSVEDARQQQREGNDERPGFFAIFQAQHQPKAHSQALIEVQCETKGALFLHGTFVYIFTTSEK